MNEEYYQIFPEKSSWFNFKIMIMKLRRQPKYYNDLLLQLDILVKMGKNSYKVLEKCMYSLSGMVNHQPIGLPTEESMF